jgi:hypothetical protein
MLQDREKDEVQMPEEEYLKLNKQIDKLKAELHEEKSQNSSLNRSY